MLRNVNKTPIRTIFCAVMLTGFMFCLMSYTGTPAAAASVIQIAGPTDSALRSAISGASPGDTIEITSDIAVGGALTILAGKDITIRSDPGNQWTLSKTSGRHFAVNGTLTLADITLDGSRISNSGGVNVNSTGVLYLNEGAVIENCSSTVASEGGGVTAIGTVVVNGGIIRNNTKNMTNGGGGVQLPSGSSGSFTMNYGAISNNTANTSNSYAGGIIAFGSGTININGGEISGNSCATYGGGISIGNTVTLNITGGKIYGNTAATNGGGVYAATGSGGVTLNISGGEISDNTSGTYGGGVYVGQNATANITGGKIAGNTAINGGGLYLTSTVAGKAFAVSNCDISDNKASNGGGVYLYSTAAIPTSIMLSNCTVSANKATTHGGGLYGSTGSSINITDSNIRGNAATSNGGGVYAADLAKLTTNNVTFQKNKASTGYRWTVDVNSSDPTVKSYSEMHTANIVDTTYTVPFTNAYNNYDVNFAYGESIKAADLIISYNPNGGTGGLDVTGFEYGEMHTVLSADAAGVAKSGLEFAGWNTQANASGAAYSAGESITVTGDLTLYALWSEPSPSPPPSFTVTFNSVGGSSVSSQTVASGGKVIKPDDPTKTDYDFAGWYTEAEYTNAWDFASDTVSSDITLYAKWSLAEIVLPPLPEETHVRYIYGYPDGTVRPVRALTRAEAAAIVYHLTDDPDKDAPIASEFSDITPGHWYYREVAYVGNRNLMAGFSDGTFRPDDPVTESEFLVIVSALEGADMDAASDLVDTPDGSITRAHAVMIVNRVTNRRIELQDIPTDIVQYSDLTTADASYSDFAEASNEHRYTRKEDGSEIWIWNTD